MSSAMPVCISERAERHDACRLTVRGELDIASAPALQARLQELSVTHRTVRLDLSQLEFIDSTGMSTILLCLREAERGGWGLEIDPRVSRQVNRLIAVAGLEHQLWPPSGR